MKRNLLILIAIVMMVGFVYADVPVNFDPSYVEADPGVIKNAYNVEKPNLTFDQADQIADQIFSYTGIEMMLDEQVLDHQVYKACDNSATLRIQNERGYLFFRKNTGNDGYVPGLPSKNKAKKLAKQYLKELGMYKNTMVEPTVVTITDAKYDGQTTTTYDKLKVVTFHRKFDGFDVLGDSRAVVMLGANGEMEGLAVHWMDVTSTKVKSKVSKADLKSYIKNQLNKKQADSLAVNVKKGNIILHDNGNTFTPTLMLIGEITLASGTHPMDWLIPLAD
jgi:hypothetical protein